MARLFTVRRWDGADFLTCAQAVNVFGSLITPLAITLVLLGGAGAGDVAGSGGGGAAGDGTADVAASGASKLAAVLFIGAIAPIVFTVVGGHIADRRWDQVRLLRWLRLLCCVQQAALAVYVACGGRSEIVIGASLFVANAIAYVSGPISRALLRDLCEALGLDFRNRVAEQTAAINFARVISPLAGGALIAVASPAVAIALDALTFLLAALLLRRVPSVQRSDGLQEQDSVEPRVQDPNEPREPHSREQHLGEQDPGQQHPHQPHPRHHQPQAPRSPLADFFATRWLWLCAVLGAVQTGAWICSYQVLAPTLVLQLGGSGFAWSLFVALYSVGSILGSLACKLVAPGSPLALSCLASALAAVFPLALGLSGNLLLGALSVLLSSGLLSVAMNMWFTALSELLPRRTFGRLSSYASAIELSGITAALGLVPVLLGVVTPQPLMLLLGSVMLAAGALNWLLVRCFPRALSLP